MVNNPEIYRGFEIHCVMKYSDGTADFNVFPPNADYGYAAPDQTLEQVKIEIDEKLSEHEATI